MRRVGIGLPHDREAVVLYLADALARDAVFAADSIKRTALAFSGKSETVGEHLSGTFRKAREEVFGDRFWLK